MSYAKLIRSTVCASALTLTGSAAFADISAEEVWASWQSQLDLYGEMITIGDQSRSGDTLTISGLSMDYDVDGVTITSELGAILLTEQGDGTVRIETPSQFEINIQDNTSSSSSGTVAVTLAGQDLVARGTPDSVSYDVSADRYSIKLTDLREDGEPVDVEFDLTLNNTSGTYLLESDFDQSTDISYALTTDSMTYLLAAQEDDTAFDISGQTLGLIFNSASTIPDGYDPIDPTGFMIDGFSAFSEIMTQGTASLMNIRDDDGETQIILKTDGGQSRGNLQDGSVDFASRTTGVAVSVSGPTIPFPVDATVGQLGMSMAFPLSQSEEPKPLGASFDVIDLQVNDTIWSLADPTGILPHDPVSIAVALDGNGRLLVDLSDEDALAAFVETDVPPFELHDIAIKNLLVSAVGAEITGEGAFTFDNNDLQTFDGFPAPEGYISLRGVGVNDLLDSLATLPYGFAEQIMGARMMLGMFTTVVGDDELTSTIEVKKDGSVSVNGQRMR